MIIQKFSLLGSIMQKGDKYCWYHSINTSKPGMKVKGKENFAKTKLPFAS